MAAIAAMFVNAQTYEPSKFIDNTYIRVSGGATALMHPECNGYENLGHTIQAVIGAEIGKWITPKFGVAFAGNFGIDNGSKFGFMHSENAFNYITVTGLVKGNVSKFFKKNPKVEVVLATGPMWIHGFPGKNYWNDFGVKFQGEVNVNMTNRLQLNFIPELNYNLTRSAVGDHPRFDSRNAWYGLQVGLTYKLGKQFTECPYTYTQADIDALNAEINDLRARQPEIVEKIVEKVVVKQSDATEAIVLFDKNSSVLSEEMKAILNTINGDVKVIGSASPEGSKSRNIELATERANVVANYLKDRKVNIKDVTTDLSIGSRTVIIK